MATTFYDFRIELINGRNLSAKVDGNGVRVSVEADGVLGGRCPICGAGRVWFSINGFPLHSFFLQRGARFDLNIHSEISGDYAIQCVVRTFYDRESGDGVVLVMQNAESYSPFFALASSLDVLNEPDSQEIALSPGWYIRPSSESKRPLGLDDALSTIARITPYDGVHIDDLDRASDIALRAIDDVRDVLDNARAEIEGLVEERNRKLAREMRERSHRAPVK